MTCPKCKKGKMFAVAKGTRLEEVWRECVLCEYKEKINSIDKDTRKEVVK